MLQGLQGTPVAKICHEHQISPSLYDPWRDPFLPQADQACEVHQHARKGAHGERAKATLKRRGGEWLLACQTRDERLG